MALGEYVRKRDFKRTPEPGESSGIKPKRGASKLRFVVQKHAARRLHYDFRLELEGTLKSWAVPKGLPSIKGEKRLAVMVEDHPLEYANFEGVIPAGQYGAGTVMVWDTGFYQSLGNNPLADLEKGKLHVVLEGKKLKGEWVLVRLKSGEANQWLLIKGGVDAKPVSKKEDNQSALSGRTLESIGNAPDAEWDSDAGNAGKQTAQRLKFIEPMKARLANEPPGQGDWIYELKFDGYRAIALKEGGRVQLFSRNAKNLGVRFPDIERAIARMPVETAIFDGEIVALDENGRPSFQLLQGLDLGTERPVIAYYLFDLLQENDRNLQDLPVVRRKDRLRLICQGIADPIRFSEQIVGSPVQLLEEVKKLGLEGIVGKSGESRYEPGRRSGAWIKIKVLNEQEFVIGGFTSPRGSRGYFGALLVGYYDHGELKFAGKVGTGFDEALLAVLHKRLFPLKRASCPFKTISTGGSEQEFTAVERRASTWVEPELVCEIRFTEWTSGGRLRQPVFLGIRDDINPKEVVRES